MTKDSQSRIDSMCDDELWIRAYLGSEPKDLVHTFTRSNTEAVKILCSKLVIKGNNITIKGRVYVLDELVIEGDNIVATEIFTPIGLEPKRTGTGGKLICVPWSWSDLRRLMFP